MRRNIDYSSMINNYATVMDGKTEKLSIFTQINKMHPEV